MRFGISIFGFRNKHFGHFLCILLFRLLLEAIRTLVSSLVKAGTAGVCLERLSRSVSQKDGNGCNHAFNWRVRASENQIAFEGQEK
jgi:hypothetical protein